MPNRTIVRLALVAAASLALAACQAPAPSPGEPGPAMPKETLARGSAPLSPALTDATAKAQAGPASQQEKMQAHLYRGTGVVVKGLQPGGGLPPGPPIQVAGGNVVLNFVGADLREVVRNIMGDILNENYTIDPAVGGTVTIRTSAGIPRDALPAALETLLRQNGATMVKSGGLYMVLPQAAAVRGNTTPQLGNSMRALVKYLDRISDADIVGLNIPNGIPLVYELDAQLQPLRSSYLGDAKAVADAAAAVARQGRG